MEDYQKVWIYVGIILIICTITLIVALSNRGEVEVLVTVPVDSSRIRISPCEDSEDCKLIRTAGGPVYRVFGCGKLDKLNWIELNPNEEPIVVTTPSVQWVYDPNLVEGDYSGIRVSEHETYQDMIDSNTITAD